MQNPYSWILESGIQLKESIIALAIGIQNPSSSDKDWNPESAWNPESNTILDSLTWSDLNRYLFN